MSYATVGDLKALLKINSTAEDTLLQSLLDEASSIIDAYIDRPSAAATPTTRTFTAEHDADGALLMFDCDYAASITAVTHDGVALTAADYFTEPRHVGPFWGLSLKNGHWRGEIAVTGYWAYTTNSNGTADDLIVGTCRTIAAWLYRAKDNVGTVVQYDDGVTVLNMALPRGVLDRLAGRKRLI